MNGFRDSNVVPPNAEWFVQPIPEGPVFRARTYDTMFREWAAWASLNNVPLPPDPRAFTEDFMCEYLPDGFCRQKGKYARLSLGQVVSFTEFMGRRLVAKMLAEPAAVELEESDRRAEICLSCPFHAPAFCVSCLGLEDMARRAMPPGPGPTREKELGACGKCGCLLRVKSRYKLKVLETLFSKKPEYPPECWMYDHGPRTPPST